MNTRFNDSFPLRHELGIANPLRHMNLSIFILMVFLLPLIPQDNSAGAQDLPVGVVVRDATAESGCTIESSLYSTLDITSEIVDSSSESCPAGSVVEVVPVWSHDEAQAKDGLFVELTGDATVDSVAISAAKSSIGPPSGPASVQKACVEGGRSKYMSFWAAEPGLTVWAYVYYWQDAFCNSGVSSTTIGVSPSGQQRFAKSMYYGYSVHHGCAAMSTGGTSHSIAISAPLGYLFTNETRSGTYAECEAAWSTSYTGSVYLT